MAADDRDIQGLVTLVQESTKASIQVARRVDALERRFETLESTLTERMGRLEDEMRSSNGHLHDLKAATDTTNDLLQRMVSNDEQDRIFRQKIAEEERTARAATLAHQRALQLQTRETAVKAGSELWLMFRGPVGYFLVALFAWLSYSVFGVRIEHFMTPATPPAIVAPASK